LIPKSDHILIGGGMAYTFMAAMGQNIGTSLFEADKVDLAKKLLDEAGDKLVLPVDTVVTKKFDKDAPARVASGDIQDDEMGMDIGPKTIELFKNTLKGAKTVVWNGPMGVFEMPRFAKGTLEIGRSLAALPDAITIVGGGDSTSAVKQLGIAPKLSHISTGGGASLRYLEGKPLPGIECISDK
jgi:phosphoglycerate kinase